MAAKQANRHNIPTMACHIGEAYLSEPIAMAIAATRVRRPLSETRNMTVPRQLCRMVAAARSVKLPQFWKLDYNFWSIWKRPPRRLLPRESEGLRDGRLLKIGNWPDGGCGSWPLIWNCTTALPMWSPAWK